MFSIVNEDVWEWLHVTGSSFDKLHKWSLEGRQNVEDDERSGWPVTSRIDEKIEELIKLHIKYKYSGDIDMKNIDWETVI